MSSRFTKFILIIFFILNEQITKYKLIQEKHYRTNNLLGGNNMGKVLKKDFIIINFSISYIEFLKQSERIENRENINQSNKISGLLE